MWLPHNKIDVKWVTAPKPTALGMVAKQAAHHTSYHVPKFLSQKNTLRTTHFVLYYIHRSLPWEVFNFFLEIFFVILNEVKNLGLVLLLFRQV